MKPGADEWPMTEEEFCKAYWKVQWYGNSLSLLILFASTPTIMLWAKPAIVGLGDLLRKHFHEAVVGWIGGLLISLILVPLFLIFLVPLLLVDRQLGIRCPGCHRSVTLRCKKSRVQETGQCCLCGTSLFKVGDPA